MPVIDVHAQLGAPPFATRAWELATVNALLERYDIQKCCLYSREAMTSNFIEGNRKLAEAIAGHARLLGYVVVNANYVEESIEEMRKHLGKTHFVGIAYGGAHCAQPVNAPGMIEILNSSRRYSKPALVHTWTRADVDALLDTAAQLKGLNFIMAHMGGDEWQYALNRADQFLNIFPEPSGGHCDRDKLRWAADKGFDRRLLFGSGMTVTNPAAMLGMVKDCDLRPPQKERILFGNAKELFGL